MSRIKFVEYFKDKDLCFRLLGIGIVIWFVSPLFAEPFGWPSTRDWGYFCFLEEVTRKTILEYGQFPLWNPYYFGGAEHLANPQTTVLSPTTLLMIPFGTVLGMKLGVAFFAIAGFLGMFRLARFWGAEAGPACISGILFGCSGWFAQHSGGGHWSFIVTALYPWAVYYFLRAQDEPRFWIHALVCSTWVAFHWGIYTIPWLFMIVLIVAVAESIARKQWKPILSYFAYGITTFGLAAVRLIPVFQYIFRFPRTVDDWDKLSLDDLFYLLTSHQTSREFPGHQWEWPEYSNYIGMIGLGLVLVAILYRYPQKKFFWIGAILFLGLYFGNWGIPAPYSLLKQLPVFENLRVPSRYTLMALFFVAPAVGVALTHIVRDLGTAQRFAKWSRITRFLPIIAIVLLFVDPVTFNREQFKQSFHLPEPDDKVWPHFVQKSGGPWRMFAYPRSNQGSVLGLEESPLPMSPAIRIDADEQHLLTLGEHGTAEETYWSPNELSFFVETDTANQLVINQNFRTEWKANGGLSVVDHRGLLAVNVPPGKSVVHLKYRPIAFTIGLLISTLTIICIVWWRALPRGKERKLVTP